MTKDKLIIGTRGTALALWQAHAAIDCIQKKFPSLNLELKTIVSEGDIKFDKPLPSIAGMGVFTKALDDALAQNKIDVAVHSHKDLAIFDHEKLILSGVLKREDARDVFVSKNKIPLKDLKKGAVIGTSSTRRRAQALRSNLSLVTKNIRGKIETRIEKALEKNGPYDGTILAYAGVKRLGLEENVTEILPLNNFLPAPAQGSIALMTRKKSFAHTICQTLDQIDDHLATLSERGFLFGLGGGCSMPVSAYARIENDQLKLMTAVYDLNSLEKIEVTKKIAAKNLDFQKAFSFGEDVAKCAIDLGAKKFLVKK